MVVLYAVAAVTVALDQITKALAVANLEGEPKVQLLGEWLQLTFVRNPGGAFGLGGSATWFLTAFAAVISGLIIWFSRKLRNRWWGLAMGLLLGGALGNFIDRWAQPPGGGSGEVVDFLELPNWPVFNVADMAVVVGAALMVVLSLLGVEFDRGRPDTLAQQADAGPEPADDHANRVSEQGRTATSQPTDPAKRGQVGPESA